MKNPSLRFLHGLVLAGLAWLFTIPPTPALAANVDVTTPPAERQRKLIALIQSDAPPAEKALALKQLAICGTADAVPALARYLGNEELGAWARTALEAIPDPAADDAFRAALTTTRGLPLVGVINSIGVRRDEKSAYPLITKLKDTDPQVAGAAAVALGKIGGEFAARALQNALPGATGSLRSDLAEGCVRCAESFLADGKAAQAVAVYDLVRKADVPQQRKLEATRGAILARGAEGIPLLLEQLRSPDKALFGIGLRTARELPGRDVTKALAAEMKQISPERQSRVLLALADRRDEAVLPAVLAAAKEGSREVRLAAFDVLQHSGNVSCVPLLLEAAAADDAAIARGAKTALAGLHGDDVDADLSGRLAKATGKERQVLIELAANRRIESALPMALRYATDPDPGVRKGAATALGILGGAKELGAVVDRLKNANEQDRANLEDALLAICGRSGPASAPTLLPLASHSDASLRMVGLHALAAVGGPEALAAVRKALNDQDESVQDDAVRTLSTWPNNWPDDAGVAEPLLTLAKSGRKPSHQVLGFRGYLQYVQGTKHLKDDEKLAKVNEIWPLLKWPEVKQLAASVVGSIPTPGALNLLTTLIADADTTEAACSAMTALASKNTPGLSREQRQKALQTVVEKTKNDATRKRAQDALQRLRR
jgi:HEAT repeat protein